MMAVEISVHDWERLVYTAEENDIYVEDLFNLVMEHFSEVCKKYGLKEADV